MNTLRITEEHLALLEVTMQAHAPREMAAFLIAGHRQDRRGHHFVVREVMLPSEADFEVHENLSLRVSPVYFNKVIGRAERSGLTVIMVHSHPFSKGEVHYSWVDDEGERVSSKTLYECLGNKPSASLLFGEDCLTGRVWAKPGTEPLLIDEVRILGRRARFVALNGDSCRTAHQPQFDRQIAVYGKQGQAFLGSLRVGIVGVGGTGSAVAEQLVRLGVRNLMLVDKDAFENTNHSRLFGSDGADLRSKKKRRKVDIVASHLRRIAPNLKLDSHFGDVLHQDVLNDLAGCDLIFSCTDRHAPRSALNEVAYQHYVPLVDLGTGIDASEGKVRGGSVRASLIAPGLPCLFCYGIIKPDVIAAELMPEEERVARAAEGYVPGLGGEAPSVVHLTSLAASLGITLATDYLFGLTDACPPTVLLDISDYALRRLRVAPRADCTCKHRLGRGSYYPISAPA